VEPRKAEGNATNTIMSNNFQSIVTFSGIGKPQMKFR
jgi:hypothetical protein